MLNVIGTLKNYFKRELLLDYFSSEVSLHFNIS